MEENATPRPISPVSDDVLLASLLTETFAEQAGGVTPTPDALVRLNARLDAGASARPWWRGHLRLAGAVAVALILLAIVTPVGRLAAAGIHNAAQAVVTTITNVKDFATGDDSGNAPSPTPNPPGTPAPTGAVNGSAVATSPTGSSTSLPGTTITGSAVTGSATRTGTNTPGTATGTTGGTSAPGISTATAGAGPAPTSTPVPAIAATAPPAAATAVSGTVAPATTAATAIPTIPPASPAATATRSPTATPTSATSGTPAGAVAILKMSAKGAAPMSPAKGEKDESAAPPAANPDDEQGQTKLSNPPKGAKDQPAKDGGKPNHPSKATDGAP